MPVPLQLVMDANNPSVLVRFWATALGYEIAPAPDGFATWNDFYRSIGVAEDELDLDGDGSDRLIDPSGRGPSIWFQPVPETKSIKNRLHLDLGVSGGRSVPLELRKARVDAEVERLVAAGAKRIGVVPSEGVVGHYGVAMQDPEGAEFCVH
ncbi:VOC family protein [Jatrophihabitans sp. DSM 45814]